MGVGVVPFPTAGAVSIKGILATEQAIQAFHLPSSCQLPSSELAGSLGLRFEAPKRPYPKNMSQLLAADFPNFRNFRTPPPVLFQSPVCCTPGALPLAAAPLRWLHRRSGHSHRSSSSIDPPGDSKKTRRDTGEMLTYMYVKAKENEDFTWI